MAIVRTLLASALPLAGTVGLVPVDPGTTPAPAPLDGAAGGRDDLTFRARVRPFLAEHCARCHGGDEPSGGLDFGAYDSVESVTADPLLWDLLRELVTYGEMPPAGEPRPTDADTLAVLDWIDATIGPAEVDGPIDPGPAPIRRLNRTEYANTVRDLFDVEIDPEAFFPPDGIGHGFDTNGEALVLSELFVERSIEAAERVAALAVTVDDSRAPQALRFEENQLSAERTRDGAVAFSTRGRAGVEVPLVRPGRYAIRARAWADNAGPELARLEVLVGEDTVAGFDVAGERGAAGHYETVQELSGDSVRLAVAFVNDYYDPEHPDRGERDRNLYVDWVEVLGPLDPPPPTAFQERLLARFGPSLDTKRQVRILEHLVHLVWRRPASPSEITRLRRLSDPQASLEETVRDALIALLASPNFLFKLELDPPASAATPIRELTGAELATRLSYFLWSSTPDEALLAAAAEGRLSDAAGLDAEVERMLADPRSRALADNFASQWLQLRRLADLTPDPERFPEFDEELREAMQRESLDVFDAVLREGGSAWELLEADWTVAGPRLARHYGLGTPDASGRLSLAGTERRGVLGHAGVLTASSHATRTSPVKRGKWILEVLLGTSPPAPPPGADSLSDEAENDPSLSFREKLEQHRGDPICASCHATMDPLGFGLERFDAIGRTRDADSAGPVDASGELPDGRAFEGALELGAILRADGRFVRTLTEKLYVYALGRGLERSDRRAIDAILADLDPAAPRLSDLVRGVVRSEPFRTRRGDTRAGSR